MTYTPDTLSAAMDQLGCPVTKRRLIDWVQKGLLPHPRPRGRGQGRGKVYQWTEPDILHRAIDVYELLAWHRRAADLFLPLWVLGYDVPSVEVQAALRRFVDGLDAGLDAAVPRFGDRSDLVSDLLADAQEQLPQQAGALPLPVLEAFLQAVVAPDVKEWEWLLDELESALVAGGEPVGWPDPQGAAALVSFVRAQLSVSRLREVVATASDAELVQIHYDLQRVVRVARAVADVGLAVDPWVVIRVLAHLGTWGAVVDLALRRAGHGPMVEHGVDQFGDACRRLLTDPRLRWELQQLRAQHSGASTGHAEAASRPNEP
jgi:hypothetical protein